jgi:LDH2 family malate/lactate/ureidoglycolate dehydrogenase
MSEIVVHVGYDELERFMKDVFIGLGVPDEDAGTCAEVLSFADRLSLIHI